MLTLDTSLIAQIMQSEVGLDSIAAKRYAASYPSIHDELAPAVSRWLKDRVIVDASVGGVTIAELMTVRRTHFLQAVRLLNRLLDEDIPAGERPDRARRLRRPVPIW